LSNAQAASGVSVIAGVLLLVLLAGRDPAERLPVTRSSSAGSGVAQSRPARKRSQQPAR
jgi:hypothetical protein